jgi:(R,R)-butanediol dehydrogenase / meso-butanediol dehydrogenase / diacetyl reductase
MAQAGTMRAAFYEGAGTFRTGTLPIPTPAANEALLRVRRVGICGTDLHIFQGHLDHRVPKGGIIGHDVCRGRAGAGRLRLPGGGPRGG